PQLRLFASLLHYSAPPLALPSFPTRRSSDLDRLISADDVVGQLDDIGLGRVQAMVHFQESDLVLAEEHGDAQGEFQRLAGRSLKDRKSTRLNSSHVSISYAVFCLKKKKQQQD